eukprot:13026366-Alexandrium_andersonii.AAC.1
MQCWLQAPSSFLAPARGPEHLHARAERLPRAVPAGGPEHLLRARAEDRPRAEPAAGPEHLLTL